MKKYNLYLTPFVLIATMFFSTNNANSQSAIICKGDSVGIRMMSAYSGTLQWQESVNQVNWSNIAGATSDSVVVKPLTNEYYRAEISDGTCQPSYSDTVLVTVNQIPTPPTPQGNGATQTQIIWNWGTVTGATGYLWNTVLDNTTATDLGASTTTTQSGLACNTSYTSYVWAYNSCGISDVSILTQTTALCGAFSCGMPLVDSRDGQSYNTVLIGTQCWMQQSLNYGTQVNTASAQGNNGVVDKYCYNNSAANCTTYGALYQWAEVVQYLNGATNSSSWNPVPNGNIQGICPTGWHIPTETEFVTIETLYGGFSAAGGHFKQVGTTTWNAPNTGADNTSGFTALGAGNINSGSSTQMGINSPFWTCTQSNASGARFHMTTYNSTNAWSGDGGKTYGYSLRCIQD